MFQFDDPPPTPEEVTARLAARRRGMPFLVFRDPGGCQQILTLAEPHRRLTVGRRDDNDVVIAWDPNVSRVHAQLEPVGRDWAVIDDGLSRNGSYLNGRRLAGRQRLRDGDVITVGVTRLLFRAADDTASSTAHHPGSEPPPLTDTQRAILAALARPCLDVDGPASPATNAQIAEEVCLSVDAVRTHLRVLFAKFGVSDLPQNQKRVSLVAAALQRAAIPPR
ncbi:MAG: FHA domain-containing protein [Acidimicrobiales bacterium]|nr:FHA domain-containing protein [Acidimicrobiales bacterium]